MADIGKNATKISVIGGGSVFTPELIAMLGKITDVTGPLDVHLMDISVERLRIVGDMCKRLMEISKQPINIVTTTDPVEAISDSSFVCNQLRAGGVPARIEDEKLGRKYRLPFTETISVCGFATFLRSFPLIVEYSQIIARVAPNAWILNFTNPAGMLSETFHRLGQRKIIGVCNVSVKLKQFIAERLHVPPSSLYMNWRGINHMTFVDQIYVNGKEMLGDVISAYDQGESTLPFPKDLIQSLGILPNPYLQYYYLKDRVIDHLQKQEKNRSEIVLEIEKDLLDEFKTAIEIPDTLKRRGGYGYSSVVANLIKDLISEGGSIHYGIVRNGSTLVELPVDSFVEVPILVHKNRIETIQIDPLPTVVKPLVISMKLYEDALIDACFNRNIDKMLHSLIMHPLIPSYNVSKMLLQDVLEVNKNYLDWLLN
jgi:6-phospho-beta-glucosidase